MLGESNLREVDLRESIADINHRRVHKNKCSCNTRPLRSLLCYCIGTTLYFSSCALSFYMGYLYEQDNCNNTTLLDKGL